MNVCAGNFVKDHGTNDTASKPM